MFLFAIDREEPVWTLLIMICLIGAVIGNFAYSGRRMARGIGRLSAAITGQGRPVIARCADATLRL